MNDQAHTLVDALERFVDAKIRQALAGLLHDTVADVASHESEEISRLKTELADELAKQADVHA